MSYSFCCCCPSAIAALFCLYLQSGCNKGTVAGALTFFPPEPALYQFQRRDANGNLVLHDADADDDDDDGDAGADAADEEDEEGEDEDDEEEDEDDDISSDGKNQEAAKAKHKPEQEHLDQQGQAQGDHHQGPVLVPVDAHRHDHQDEIQDGNNNNMNVNKNQRGEETEMHQDKVKQEVVQLATRRTNTNHPAKTKPSSKPQQQQKKKKKIEIQETRQETNRRMKSPMDQLMDQVHERYARSKLRNARDARDVARGMAYSLWLDPRLQIPPHDVDCIRAVKIPTTNCHTKTTTTTTTTTTTNHNVYIAAVGYLVPPERNIHQTLILSHGNATDIGAMFPIQVVLAHALDINVVSYDYSGYGESGGVPDETATYRDLTAVIRYVQTEIANNNPKNIILYGQSVGSGPCCYAAMRETYGGMILHSPFTSGMRVLTTSRALACLDIYPNIDRIRHVRCPVMILHGCLDQEVDISHGQTLHEHVPPQYQRAPWWVPDRGHNDITDGPGRLAEYIRRLRTFLEHLDNNYNNNNNHDHHQDSDSTGEQQELQL